MKKGLLSLFFMMLIMINCGGVVKAARCPLCGSKNMTISYQQYSASKHKIVLPVLVVVVVQIMNPIHLEVGQVMVMEYHIAERVVYVIISNRNHILMVLGEKLMKINIEEIVVNVIVMV